MDCPGIFLARMRSWWQRRHRRRRRRRHHRRRPSRRRYRLAMRKERSRNRLQGLRHRLWWQRPLPEILERGDRLRALSEKAQRLLDARLAHSRQQVAALIRTLEAVSPLSALTRGYVIVTQAGGDAITRARQAKTGEAIELNFQDGVVDAVAQGQRPPPQRWRTPRTGTEPGK